MLPRDSGERAARTWLVYQTVSGGGSYSRPVVARRESSGWVVSERGVEGGSAAPTLPALDSAEDRRRIAAVAAAFAEGWNRQDFDAMGNTSGPGEYARQADARNFRARFAAPMTHTRLDAETLVIELSDTQRMSATGRMEMRGTWAPRSGAIVPLDPWKQEGAVTAVKLTFAKHTSAWEPGDWYIIRVDPPWARNH
jgi:hypothetical protein